MMRLRRSFLILVSLVCLAFSSVAQSEYQIKTIVLDAGHGGHDTGCRGVTAYEKDVTLSIVLKVGELIKKNYPSIKVIYTRKTDEFIELYERANIANRNNADLFISVHCNASKSHTPFGTETWLMGLHKSESNLEVSKRENDVILMEDNYQQNYDGFDPNSPEGYIILTMNQNAHMNQSIELASKVEEQFSSMGRTSRGVKQAGFLVLWRTTMPAILIESGFLTNREEEKYLVSEAGQNDIATSIVNAVTTYIKEVEGIQGGAVATGTELLHTSDTAGVKSSSVGRGSIDNSPVVSPASANSQSVIYRIQISASSKPIDKKDPRYAEFKDLSNDRSESGINRYMVGNYSNLDACMADLSAIRKKGFKDAFVVAYKDGKRTPLQNIP